MYTTMRYFPDTGDIGGLEVFLLLGQNGGNPQYFALVQFAEGAPNRPVLVAATVKGNTVEFSIPESVSAVGTFRGVVTDRALVGTFGTSDSPVRLPRGKSYWQ